MRRFIILLAVALQGLLLTAQTRTVRPIEVELNAGAGVVMNKLDYAWNSFVQAYGVEARYNVLDGRFDIGLGLRGGIITRASETVFSKVFVPINLYAVADYNYFVSNNLSLFAGLAVGVTYQKVLPGTLCAGDWMERTYNGKIWSPYLAPRVGVECWDRLRLTLACQLTDPGSQYTGIHLGYVFGGRKQ